MQAMPSFTEAFRGRRSRLTIMIDTKYALLEELVFRRVINFHHKQAIESKPTSNVQVEKLLEILLRRPDSDFDNFCKALEKTGQESVVKLMRQQQAGFDDTLTPLPVETPYEHWKKNKREGHIEYAPDESTYSSFNEDSSSKRPTHTNPDLLLMSAEHKTAFRQRRQSLVAILEVNELLNVLVSMRVLTVRDSSRIRGRFSRPSQVEELVDTMLRKSEGAFYDFISALHRTNQYHVARLLTGDTDDMKTVERRRRLAAQRKALDESIDPFDLVFRLHQDSDAATSQLQGVVPSSGLVHADQQLITNLLNFS